MFHLDTLNQALNAAGQSISQAELMELYDQAESHWEMYLDQNEQQLTHKYQQQKNTNVVEAMDRMTLMNLAQQLADEAIYADYIQPLTDQASTLLPDWDEDEISPQDVLESPNLWQTHWAQLPHSPEMSQIVHELWPDKTSPWTTVANSYMMVLDYQGKDYPAETGSSLMPAFEQQVDQAVAKLTSAR